MFKEVLQIIPKMSPSDLNNMERSLSNRFGNVAKKFGKGLTSSLKGGFIAGIALGLIDKLLNPLKETREAIERTLAKGNDIETNAKHFGTTAGKLLRLQALAQAQGLDAGSLSILMEKFQGAVAEAAHDPTKPSAVREFVGDKDTADSFFQFIQQLKKLSGTQQTLVQQEVFGEKQILKMAEFLQSDFPALIKALGGPTAEKLTEASQKTSKFEGDLNTGRARQDLTDFIEKARLINDGMISESLRNRQKDLNRENRDIAHYKTMGDMAAAVEEIKKWAQLAYFRLGEVINKAIDINKQISDIKSSPLLKGIMKYVGGGGK